MDDPLAAFAVPSNDAPVCRGPEAMMLWSPLQRGGHCVEGLARLRPVSVLCQDWSVTNSGEPGIHRAVGGVGGGGVWKALTWLRPPSFAV